MYTRCPEPPWKPKGTSCSTGFRVEWKVEGSECAGMRLQFGMQAGLRQERSTSPNKKTEDPGGWN